MRPIIARLSLAICWVLPVVAPRALDGSPPATDRAGTGVPFPRTTRPRRRTPTGQRVSVTWSRVPLRDALERLGATQQRTILLDRRIDPGRRLELAVDDLPFDQVVAALAEQAGLRADRLGGVTYLGPAESGPRLSTVAASRREAARRLPATMRRRWMARRTCAWKVLATPQSILERLAKEAEAKIERLDLLPHDLWPAADLPPLALTDRVTLVLYGFGLSFRFDADGRSIRLVPIDRLQLDAPAPAARASARPAARPSARPVPQRRRTTAGTGDQPVGQRRYTLRVKAQPIGHLLEQLGRQLPVELQIDRAAIERRGIDLKRRVSFQVRQATLEELLTAALRPAGLTFRRRDRIVRIEPLAEDR